MAVIGPLGRWPRWLLVVSTLALVILVGAADYLTGHELLFSTFYLVPVAMAAWLVGRAFAVLVAVLSVGAWVVGDLAAGAVFAHAFVPVWNAGIILAFYLVVVALLVQLRRTNLELEVRVRQRTMALTEEMVERERLEREVLDVGERERRRIGRDLHDSLGQLLTGTALAGQVLREKLTERAPDESRDAERVVRLVEEAIEMTRSLARGLDPVEVEGGGLAQGLRELAARTSELGQVRCDYVETAPVAIRDPVTATHLYRIAQEAITNAIKHGHASNVLLRLEREDGRVRLTIHDDGGGLPPGPRQRPGMGLRIMAHRAAVTGGTFEIHGEPGAGTTVRCEVPDA